MTQSERLRVALTSARDLAGIINSLTEEELRLALQLEYQSKRRPVMLARMVKRIVSLVTTRTRNELVREYTPWLDKNQSS